MSEPALAFGNRLQDGTTYYCIRGRGFFGAAFRTMTEATLAAESSDETGPYTIEIRRASYWRECRSCFDRWETMSPALERAPGQPQLSFCRRCGEDA